MIELRMIKFSSLIALFCFACLLFVNWKTGSDWWVKIGPCVYWGFTITGFIIMPIISIIMFVLFVALPFQGEGSRDLYLCWKVVNVSYCIGYLVTYSFPSLFGDGKSVHTRIKKHINSFVKLREDVKGLNE